MRKRIYIFLLIMAASGPVHQEGECRLRYSSNLVSRSYFAFNLMSGPNSSLVNFALVTFYDVPGIKPEVHYISRDEFLLQSLGKHRSVANPNTENLFVKYEIQDCSLSIKTDIIQSSITCSVVDDLWKLRHSEFPVKDQVGKSAKSGGWAGNPFSPSEGQMNLLKKFGVVRISDFFYGENAFRLLRSMQDAAWLDSYIAAK